jgi:hypothetical protein
MSPARTHSISVAALDPFGQLDPTPAEWRWPVPEDSDRDGVPDEHDDEAGVADRAEPVRDDDLGAAEREEVAADVLLRLGVQA